MQRCPEYHYNRQGFSEVMDAGASRSRMNREVKSAPRIYVYFNEDRPLSLLRGKTSNVINLSFGVGLGTTGLIAGWSQLLGAQSLVSFGEWEAMMMSTCTHPCLPLDHFTHGQ